MKENKHFILFFIWICLPVFGFSQSKELIRKADSLHAHYEFQASRQLYNSVIKSSTDSTVIQIARKKLIQSENGINLLKFSSSPIVRANRHFDLKEFLLHIDGLKDHSWISLPNILTSESLHRFYTAVYYPEGSHNIVFSKLDDSGSWNIYQTRFNDSTGLWSAPQLLSERICSSGDEIFPLLSEDGKELYFSSNGHYSMGGYDLYVSRWEEDTQHWSIPENLGFPYSSTADDILFFNSPDGQYSIYASNRYCSGDSIAVIVSEFDKIHIKKELKNITEIRKIAAQEALSNDELRIEEIESETVTNNMDSYSRAVRSLKRLEKEFKTINDKLNESRNIYAQTENEDDRIFIAEIIAENEQKSNILRLGLDSAKNVVQKLELEFLSKGIIPTVQEEEKQDPGNELTAYTYPEQDFGQMGHFVMEKPIEKFDYTFKILKQAQYAEDMTLPKTLTYQIQLMVTSHKVPLSKLKGMSPIYERKTSSGKYIYKVGRFTSYADASASLNTVHRKGYQKAYIVAYSNGKNLSIRNAREMEKDILNSMKYQIVFKGYADEMPMSIISAIKTLCSKDIVKSFDGNGIVYTVGPFDKKAKAQDIVRTLSGLGITGMSIQNIN